MIKRNRHKKVYPEQGRRVFVAMSGGVDSSVAALLLKRRGYDVVGIFMRCTSGELSRTTSGSPSVRLRADCTAEADATDARRVAEHLKIPFYVWDFEEEYKRQVVDYMIDGYRRGITPNPDVMCNKEIKFGLFLKKALSMGADHVATGHYVRLLERKNFIPSTHFVRPATRSFILAGSPLGKKLKRADHAEPAAGVSENKVFSLFTAKDHNKDQSYFLWTLTQEQLRYCLFPIGDYLKSKVREMARRAGLTTADKKDSQGICFLGKVTLDDFLSQYIPEKRGLVMTTAGRIIGEHKGAYFYTIGQRHLGRKYQVANNNKGQETTPVYVAQKDVKTNTLVLVEGDENPALYRQKIELTDINFIDPQLITNNQQQVYTRVRYRQPLTAAIIKCRKSSVVSCKLTFAKAQKFVAPGQSAVFYTKEGELLGGGVIL